MAARNPITGKKIHKSAAAEKMFDVHSRRESKNLQKERTYNGRTLKPLAEEHRTEQFRAQIQSTRKIRPGRRIV